MDPITLSLLFMAGAKISSTLFQQHFQSKENTKNRNEMRQLAETQRQDQLFETNRQNKLNEQSVGLTSKKLSFQNKMLNESILDQNKQKQRMSGIATQNQLDEVSSNLGFTQKDQSLKDRILGRV